MIRQSPHYHSTPRRSAFTLIEAMISAVLIVVLGLTIITLLIQTFRTHQFERERTVALNRASQRVEELKRVLFPLLRGSTSSITLDVLNTPSNTADDIPATLVVKLRDRAGSIIANAPPGNASVRLEVTVTWAARGRTHSQSVHTILTP